MRFFKKRERSLSPKQEQMAGKMAEGILRGQRLAADYLNRKAARLSGKVRLGLLVGFCLAFGSYFLYVMIRAIQ